MSKYIATRAIRGANALVIEAETMLKKAGFTQLQFLIRSNDIDHTEQVYQHPTLAPIFGKFGGLKWIIK